MGVNERRELECGAGFREQGMCRSQLPLATNLVTEVR